MKHQTNKINRFNQAGLITFPLLVMLFAFLPSSFLIAQNSPKFMNTKDDDGKLKNAIKMNLMNAAFSYPSFAYERRLNEHVAFQLEGSFRMGSKSNTASTSLTNDSKSVTSYVIYPSLRYYFYESEKMKLENYFSVYYKYRTFKSVNNLDYNNDYYNPDYVDYSNTYTETTNGAGLLLGVQTASTSHFVFDLYFGTQLQSSSGSFKFYNKNANLSGFKTYHQLSSVSDAFSIMNSSSLRAGFTIGVRF